MFNPYLKVFVIGEVMRRGVLGPPEKSTLKIISFVIYSITHFPYAAPLYWYWMMRKQQGRPICAVIRRELPPME